MLRVLITNPLEFPISVLVPFPNLRVCVPLNAESEPVGTCILIELVVPAIIELCGGSIIVKFPALQLIEVVLIFNKWVPCEVLVKAVPELPSILISPPD